MGRGGTGIKVTQGGQLDFGGFGSGLLVAFGGSWSGCFYELRLRRLVGGLQSDNRLYVRLSNNLLLCYPSP